jgi:hypothetical protein
MSTQRREDGSTPATNTHRRVPRNRWQRRICTDPTVGLGRFWLGFIVWLARAIATVGTAPPKETEGFPKACFHPSDKELSPGPREQSATNSLQSDHSTTKLVRQDLRRTPRSAPPFRAGRRALTGTPATRRSSVPLTPSTAELVSVCLSWPNHPAGKCRWTERYDGQRNLHFLNAA